MAEPMDEFEKELRDGLQLRPAPPGFAGRVLGRVAERESRRHSWIPLWRWAVAAVLVVAMVVGGGVERNRRQRIEGQRARAQVLLALRIAGTTLHDVQRKMATNGDHPQSEDGGSGGKRTQP